MAAAGLLCMKGERNEAADAYSMLQVLPYREVHSNVMRNVQSRCVGLRISSLQCIMLSLSGL